MPVVHICLTTSVYAVAKETADEQDPKWRMLLVPAMIPRREFVFQAP